MLKISIVLVCFNSENYIEQTLNSIVSQNFKNIELIVIDGGSTDSTINILSKYKNYISKYISEMDEGVYDAMNKGFKNATGDVIGFLNSDDFFYSEYSLSYINEFFQNGNFDLCFGNIYYVNRIDSRRLLRYWDSSNFSLDSLSGGIAPPHPTFYLRRELQNKVGYFNLNYKYASDFDFMMRALYKSRSFGHIDKILVMMRSGGLTNGNLFTIFYQNIEIIYSLKSNSLFKSYLFYFYFKIKERFHQKLCIYS